MWVEKSFEKKFQSLSYPFTEFMDTKLAESIPFLKNLSPIPGVRGWLPSAAGLAAEDNLTIPKLAP